MPRLPQVNQDANTWGTLLNEYLSREHAADGAHGAVTATSVTTPSLTVGIIQADDLRAKGPISDVRAFGAWGNGDHDDTDAIKAAIHHAKATGGVVYLPAGQYKCGPLQLEGVAMVGSVIRSNPRREVPHLRHRGGDPHRECQGCRLHQ
jgi:polygalacturonase